MTVPAAYTARLRRAEARRGERCVVCGHRRTIPTEAGPMCAAHERQLPPPVQVFSSEHMRDDQGHNDAA